MPYIDESKRPQLDRHIDKLAQELNSLCEVNTDFAGLLNYSCTQLAMKVIPSRRYWTLALVVGVFVTLVAEFIRRIVNPYEDDAIAKNGDISEYK